MGKDRDGIVGGPKAPAPHERDLQDHEDLRGRRGSLPPHAPQPPHLATGNVRHEDLQDSDTTKSLSISKKILGLFPGRRKASGRVKGGARPFGAPDSEDDMPGRDQLSNIGALPQNPAQPPSDSFLERFRRKIGNRSGVAHISRDVRENAWLPPQAPNPPVRESVAVNGVRRSDLQDIIQSGDSARDALTDSPGATGAYSQQPQNATVIVERVRNAVIARDGSAMANQQEGIANSIRRWFGLKVKRKDLQDENAVLPHRAPNPPNTSFLERFAEFRRRMFNSSRKDSAIDVSDVEVGDWIDFDSPQEAIGAASMTQVRISQLQASDDFVDPNQPGISGFPASGRVLPPIPQTPSPRRIVDEVEGGEVVRVLFSVEGTTSREIVLEGTRNPRIESVAEELLGSLRGDMRALKTSKQKGASGVFRSAASYLKTPRSSFKPKGVYKEQIHEIGYLNQHAANIDLLIRGEQIQEGQMIVRDENLGGAYVAVLDSRSVLEHDANKDAYIRAFVRAFEVSAGKLEVDVGSSQAYQVYNVARSYLETEDKAISDAIKKYSKNYKTIYQKIFGSRRVIGDDISSVEKEILENGENIIRSLGISNSDALVLIRELDGAIKDLLSDTRLHYIALIDDNKNRYYERVSKCFEGESKINIDEVCNALEEKLGELIKFRSAAASGNVDEKLPLSIRSAATVDALKAARTLRNIEDVASSARRACIEASLNEVRQRLTDGNVQEVATSIAIYQKIASDMGVGAQVPIENSGEREEKIFNAALTAAMVAPMHFDQRIRNAAASAALNAASKGEMKGEAVKASLDQALQNFEFAVIPIRVIGEGRRDEGVVVRAIANLSHAVANLTDLEQDNPGFVSKEIKDRYREIESQLNDHSVPRVLELYRSASILPSNATKEHREAEIRAALNPKPKDARGEFVVDAASGIAFVDPNVTPQIKIKDTQDEDDAVKEWLRFTRGGYDGGTQGRQQINPHLAASDSTSDSDSEKSAQAPLIKAHDRSVQKQNSRGGLLQRWFNRQVSSLVNQPLAKGADQDFDGKKKRDAADASHNNQTTKASARTGFNRAALYLANRPDLNGVVEKKDDSKGVGFSMPSVNNGISTTLKELGRKIAGPSIKGEKDEEESLLPKPEVTLPAIAPYTLTKSPIAGTQVSRGSVARGVSHVDVSSPLKAEISSKDKAKNIINLAIDSFNETKNMSQRKDVPQLLLSALLYVDRSIAVSDKDANMPSGKQAGFNPWSRVKQNGGLGDFDRKGPIALYLLNKCNIDPKSLESVLYDMQVLSYKIQESSFAQKEYSKSGTGLRSFRVVRMLMGVENARENDGAREIDEAYAKSVGADDNLIEFFSKIVSAPSSAVSDPKAHHATIKPPTFGK